MAYSARILSDSISLENIRLTTMEVTFPRFVLAEFNTHRVFSRNSASSRAIPFKKQVERANTDPFIPGYWGKNQSGMQANVEVDEKSREAAIAEWLQARDYAIAQATALNEIGVHKQIVNRLLEPFMWHTAIVTATEWANFFALRTHREAQPEIQTIARMMREEYDNSRPQLVLDRGWHLPLIQPDEYDGEFEHSVAARKIAAARCARVSYLTHEGKRDLDADLALYDRLANSGHMSPLEHVATPFRQERINPGDGTTLDQPAWSGNFRGWLQLRKTVPNEDVYVPKLE